MRPHPPRSPLYLTAAATALTATTTLALSTTATATSTPTLASTLGSTLAFTPGSISVLQVGPRAAKHRGRL